MEEVTGATSLSHFTFVEVDPIDSQGHSVEESTTIIVPIHAATYDAVYDLARHYNNFHTLAGADHVQIIIVDNSDEEYFRTLHSLLDTSRIQHIAPDREFTGGLNKKMNNIHAGLAVATGGCICLLDDDVRPTPEAILAVHENVRKHGLVRVMASYRDPDFFDRVDMSGIFLVNASCKQRQFWGNICFRASLLTADNISNVPDLKNSVFDELSVERKIVENGGASFYQRSPALEMARSNRNLSFYLEQRVRYAYENLAFPVRTALFASLLPLLSRLSRVRARMVMAGHC